MRKNKIKYFAYLIAFVFISCKNKSSVTFENVASGNKQFIIEKVFDPKGDVINELQLSIDSIKNGFYKEYDLGRVKCLGYYKNGLKDSTWTYFGTDSEISKKENWFNGKKFGEQLEYTASIDKYIFNSIEGDTLFYMSFDKNSRAIASNGSPLYIAYNNQNIKINNEFDLICFFGIPPKCSYQMNIDEWDVNNNKQLSHVVLSDKSDDVLNLYFGKKFMKTKVYNIPGIYNWKIKYAITDSINNSIIQDTSSIEVTVFK
jgi:antitoxin component YwqK of YwqJK toxin-antitoxin module